MVAGQKDQGEVEQTCHVGGEFTAEDIRQTPTLTVRAMRIFFKLLHRGLVMLKDLIRGSFLLKISWQPMWCAAPFTYNARTGVLNGLTFPPQGKLAPQFKDPTQRAISHQLDLTYAKSLCDWLIFGFFLPCVLKCQPRKSPGFTPGSEGSMPDRVMVRRGWVGWGGGANTEVSEMIGLELGAHLHPQQQLRVSSVLCLF